MSKFLSRLLTFSILLGAIPIIFIGVISYLIASGDIEDKVKEGNEQILLQTQMRVEQVMRTLELSAVQYANSPLILKSITETLTPNNFQQVRDLSQGLYSLQSFGSIREAYLISLNSGWSINFRSFQPFESLLNHDELATYARLPNSLNWIATVANESAYPEQLPERIIRMVLKIPFVQAERPQGLIVTELPENEIKQLLTESVNFGEMMVLDEKGNDFLYSEEVGKTERGIIAREIFSASQLTAGQGSFEIERGGESVIVTYRVSPYNNWVYASVVSISEITKQSRNIGWITFFACLLILLAVASFGFYGSRRIYSPVHRLFEFTREIEPEYSGESRPATSKGKDEFVWIEDRLRQLSSKGQQLQQQIRGQYTQLKEFFMLKLFTGQLSESDYAYRSSMYGLPTKWKKLGVLTLQIDTLESTRYGEHDRELLLFAINNIVAELVSEERPFSPIVLGQSQVTLLVLKGDSDPISHKQELHELAGVIKAKVDEYLQLTVSIGISRPFVHITDAMKAYTESLEALKVRISLGSDLIIHAEDIESGKELKAAIYAQLKFMEDQLVNSVKQGNREKTDALFGEYIAAIVVRDVHFNEYPVLMLQLVSNIYQLVHEQGSTVQKALGEGATVEEFLKLTTLDAIVRWFKQQLFDPLFAFLAEREDTQYVGIANQMVKIIHERYEEELSLEMCATILNFHPVYLSRVFRKETRVNFVDYLVEYRMTIAKNLLETTTDKVSEIAERLRYTNTSSFIRTFRRITSMTPGQYRGQFQQK
ncbi:helix-turn-helix domain-containing protein [Paenibacillus sp. 5J-6]|uniref:Helix-turn-helix domain-containing protein n=1 Tax=Paenibacillus silvestris TaxID=2606219 RepID=A0A6L8URJ7_9BACL|nr:helix-turn-helix domain-containing protein [Paenibacillus silvestris]MZQ80618.1 helix-turn-helix domain-containing protein [Paenibacillus silvestris]